MNRKDDKFTPLFFTQTLFLGIFFAIPLFSFAQNGPISKIQNVQINQNTISGEILFLNDVSTTAFDNVFLTILLSEKTQETKSVINGIPTTVVKPGAMILTKTDKDFFTLFSQSESARDFSLEYPTSIPTGVYRLEARVVTISGDIVTATFQDINLIGEGNFLKIDQATCKLMLDKMIFGPNDGPNLFPGENPKVSCKVTNLTPVNIEVIPVISLATYFAYGFPQTDLKEIKLDKVVFKPKESKTITLEIPSPLDPQVYQAGLQFHDTLSGEINSSLSFFRWVVKGEAARIHSVTLDRSRYEKGSKAEISVSIYISPDLFWNNYQDLSFVKADPKRFSGSPITKPILRARLVSSSGVVCGQGETKSDTPFTADEMRVGHIVVPIVQDCVDPKAEVSFSDGENLLASVNYTKISLPAERSTNTSFQLVYYLITGLALILSWSIYNKMKK